MPLSTNPVSVKTIANLIGGEVLGDSSLVVFGLCPFDEPQDNYLTLTKERIPKRLQQELEQLSSIAKHCAVLVYDTVILPTELKQSIIKTKDPIAALIKLVPLFSHTTPHQSSISLKAEVHNTALIGRNVSIGAFSVIQEGVVIEDNVIIHPQVVLYPHCKIGADSIIHSGAVIRESCEVGANSIIQNGAIIGADGFGYVPTAEGLEAVPQIGKVLLKAKVEVGANSCIDRATLGTTTIGTDTKIDNLVQIGHNVKIGEHTIICGQSGVAGSTKIGSFCVLGGNVGVKDHITIADKVRVGAKSGVISDIEQPGDYAGFPTVRAAEFRRQIKVLGELGRKRGKGVNLEQEE